MPNPSDKLVEKLSRRNAKAASVGGQTSGSTFKEKRKPARTKRKKKKKLNKASKMATYGMRAAGKKYAKTAKNKKAGRAARNMASTGADIVDAIFTGK